LREQFGKVQRQYGRQAPFYANAAFYGAGESLEAMTELASLGRYRWAVDIASGGGYTAFALAPCAQHYIVSDLTQEMLLQAWRVAQERGVKEIDYLQVTAEVLPFVSGSLDLVTCRLAAHHFPSLEDAAQEVARVLGHGGVFLLADTVPPEDDAVAQWMDEVERRRDPSHVCNRRPSQWWSLLKAHGFRITHSLLKRVHLEFNDWVERAGTPEVEVESLRREFLDAPTKVKEAFGITPAGRDILFYWPCLVVRAVKD